MKIKCNFCHEELDRPGAIFLGPPDKFDMVFKQHMCENCYRKINTWLLNNWVKFQGWLKNEQKIQKK